VARFRKTAIAAAAVSALVFAPTAAYADHNHRGVSTSSRDLGMNWAHYSGTVTDYRTNPDPAQYPDINPNVFKDIFEGARASAVMIGMNDKSFFRLRVTGIDATSGTYGVHLHQGKCDANYSGDLPDGPGPHYNVTWQSIGLSGPDLKKTEVWLDLKVDSDRDARSTATVSFIPEEGTRSIVFHAKKTENDGTAGPRLACLPFKINVYGN